MEQTEKKMLGIIEREIAVYEGMVESEMKRVKGQSDPSLVSIAAESLGRYNYALGILKELKAKMEEEAR